MKFTFPLLLLCSVYAFGQREIHKIHIFSGLHKDFKFNGKYAFQFQVGPKWGLNYSQPRVTTQNQVINTRYFFEDKDREKVYKNFKDKAFQYGVVMNVRILRYLAVSLEPAYFVSKYHYNTQYSWVDSTGLNTVLDLDYKHTHTIKSVNLPLMLKYYISNRKVKPYAALGIYCNYMLRAKKEIDLKGNNQYANGVVSYYGAENKFDINNWHKKANWGAIGGVGVGYDIGNINVGLSAQFQYGFSQITNKATLYSNKELMVGYYDVGDLLKLSSAAFSVHILYQFNNKFFNK